jgi:hypothetical protein
MPKPPAPPLARTSAAFSAVAVARPGASLVALILALLLRILARTEAAWFLPEEDEEYDEYEDEYGFDAYAFCGVSPYALHPRPVGSAPHAIWVEAGLVADWILAGVRNRGMRALPSPPPPARHTPPVRAPPRAPAPPCAPPGRRASVVLKSPSRSRAPTHAHSQRQSPAWLASSLSLSPPGAIRRAPPADTPSPAAG